MAVAAIIAGWALAQQPTLLPGLTVAQAAAPHDTLVAIVIAVLAGAAILFPSPTLLFRLVVRGTFEAGAGAARRVVPPTAVLEASGAGLLARGAGASLIGGVGFLTLADASWAHTVGVICLLAFIVLGFVAVGPDQLAREP
jgi:cytochrome d ubiquinol oxidase subunit II